MALATREVTAAFMEEDYTEADSTEVESTVVCMCHPSELADTITRDPSIPFPYAPSMAEGSTAVVIVAAVEVGS